MSAVEQLEPALPQALTRWPGYLMDFIAEHSTGRFERELAEDGIKAKHVTVLAAIDDEGPMSQRALCRRLRIDKSPMVGLVDDLEARDYAERRRDDSDRRIQAIHITPAGTAALRRAERIGLEEHERTLAPLDEDEREQLQRMLLRVAESFA